MSFLKLVDLDALSRFKAKIMQLIPSAWAGSSSAGGPATIANGLPSGKVDSTSTATAFTATISGITEYYDGLTIILKNGIVTSASGFTLNINGLGAKPSYSNMATGNDVTPTAPTRDTTIFNINYTMIFVYSVDVVDGGGWVCYRGYDANTNTLAYQVRTQAVSLPMDSITYRYRLLFQSVNGKKFVPANNSNSTNATASRTVIQTPIDPFGLIMYYGTTASVAAGAKPSSSYLWQQFNGISLGYSFNRTGAALTMTASLPIYLKCAPQSNGSAIIDSTTPFVQALPSTADGKIYIFLGIAESATAMMLTLEHPVYEYVDGAVRQWTNAAKPTIPSPSSATPQALGTATAGSSTDYSRADHVHAMPTASNVGAIPAPANPIAGQVLGYNGSAWGAVTPTASMVGAIPAPDDTLQHQVLAYYNNEWRHWDVSDLLKEWNATLVEIVLDGNDIPHIMESSNYLFSLFASDQKCFFYSVMNSTEYTFFEPFYFSASSGEIWVHTFGLYNNTTIKFRPDPNDGGATMVGIVETIDTGEDKVNSFQGSENAGKFLVVGNDGIVAPVTMSAWQGGNY